MDINEEIPDFSGDDFANDKDVQESRAAIRAYEEAKAASFSIIKNSLNAKEASHKNLKGFTMFRNLEAIISESFAAVVQQKELQISLAEYGSFEYIFGLFLPDQHFPKTYIHKETAKEKFADLFLKNDIDFKNSVKFSRKFHVITEDRNRLENLLQFKDLEGLTDYPEMEIELNENGCLFRSSRKPVSPEEASAFAGLAKYIIRIFNR